MSIWLLLAIVNGYFFLAGNRKYLIARLISLIACLLSLLMIVYRGEL